MKQVIASLTALFVFATTGVAQVDISFQNELQRSIDPVSYTHLTLPTN